MISFLYNYLKLSLWCSIYYFQEQKSEVVFDIIVQNIKNSGCIAIKFVQWILPKIECIYMINKEDKNNKWFYELESIYENCNYHSIEYTKNIYKKEFNKNFEEDYTFVKTIASGSIGQVYQIKDKNDKLFTLKILHPNLNSQIRYIYYIIQFINIIPFLRRYIQWLIPVNLNSFIDDFYMQTDLINEANNCLKFQHTYHNTEHVIIPELYLISKNILVMSYEESESFYDLDVSDYTKCKIIMLFKLFNKNNETITNFIHGDLHKGNWKVRYNKEQNEYYIVIYDFGYCWMLPNCISDNIDFINRSFLKILDTEKEIHNFARACWYFINKQCSIETITDNIKLILDNNRLNKIEEPQFLLNLVIRIARDEKILVDSYCIQCIILYNQIWRLYEKYNITSTSENSNLYEEYYLHRIYDLINYCETNNIFIDYKNYLLNELEIEKKHNPKLEKKNIFKKIEDDYSFLKDLCNTTNHIET